MAREKGAWSEATYQSRAAVVQSQGGRATLEAEQRVKQGKGLDTLVDPKARGVIRVAGNLLVPVGDVFELPYGIAMPVKTDTDTTASMGQNVDIAFAVQPKVQNLLIQGRRAVLKRYHAQLATGSIGDRTNRYPYQATQFEPDNEVERQMGLLVPERNGGRDTTEDYQLSLFATAYLTKTTIVEYGLRGYYSAIGDERGRDTFDAGDLKRVFGPDVLKLAFGSDDKSLPSVKDTAKQVLKNWHGFFLQVYDTDYTKKWWGTVFGKERIIELPRTEDLAEIQAVVIGLSEGTLDLQSASDFLRENEVSAADAKRIVEACTGIPLREQCKAKDFDAIPLAGAKFASRDDIWPIGSGKETKSESEPAGDKKKWKI